MSARAAVTAHLPASPSLDSARARSLERLGLHALRYSLVLVLVLFGTSKFTAAEAAAIQPLVSNSPLMSWLYAVLSERAASAAIGTAELVTAALLAARPASARLGVLGGLLAVGTFLTTLSFLITTPGALGPAHPAHAFLAKDVVLLGAAVALATEALRAMAEPRSRSGA